MQNYYATYLRYVMSLCNNRSMHILDRLIAAPQKDLSPLQQLKLYREFLGLDTSSASGSNGNYANICGPLGIRQFPDFSEDHGARSGSRHSQRWRRDSWALRRSCAEVGAVRLQWAMRRSEGGIY